MCFALLTWRWGPGPPGPLFLRPCKTVLSRQVCSHHLIVEMLLLVRKMVHLRVNQNITNWHSWVNQEMGEGESKWARVNQINVEGYQKGHSCSMLAWDSSSAHLQKQTNSAKNTTCWTLFFLIIWRLLGFLFTIEPWKLLCKSCLYWQHSQRTQFNPQQAKGCQQ